MKALLTLFLILSGYCIQAQNYTISGNITDQNSEPLPYTNIIITGTSNGTSANFAGEYSLTLPKGTYDLTFQFIGYKSQQHQINLTNGNLEFDVSLQEELLSLKEVVVDGEDLAYDIIKNAQAKRKNYLDEFEDYQYSAYTKIFAKGESVGSRLTLFGTPLVSEPGVFYLSETIANMRLTGRDQRTETLTASLISGDTSTYSANKSVFIQFYNNRPLSVNERRFISPIANDAFKFYDYEFEGFFMENDQLINKIKIKPRDPGSPAFNGYIYIIEDSWRIHSVDVLATRSASSIGEIEIKISFTELPEIDTWVPFAVDLNVKAFNDIEAYYHTVQSNYDFDISDEEPLPIGLRYRILDGARSKTDDFWTQSRPIPLTKDESATYNKSAMLQQLRGLKDDGENTDSPADSVMTNNAKLKSFHISQVLFGDRQFKLSDRWTFTTKSIISTIANFNTVEGFVLNHPFRFERTAANSKRTVIIPELRYGFSSQKFYGKIGVEQELNIKKPSKINFSAGQFVEQISGFQSMLPITNTLYSLLAGENYMKLYEKTFVQLSYKKELFNGFDLTLSTEYANRNPLFNNSDFSFQSEDTTNYTSNRPEINGLSGRFNENNLLKFGAMINFAISRPYNELPERKEILATNYPVIKLAYEYGAEDSNYQLIWANVKDSWAFGTAGISTLSASYGRFLQDERLFVTELFHFAGNQTALENEQTSYNLTYQLLDYYMMSDDQQFFGANFRHNFDGAILSNVPLLSLLQAKLALTANYLNTAENPGYTEAGIGLENIRGAFSISYFRSFQKDVPSTGGVVVGFGLNIN